MYATASLPKYKRIFALYWIVLFALYLPAIRAGFVADSISWLEAIRDLSFWDYLNRTSSEIKSQYQFTQLITYLLFMVLGTHSWLWHLLFITMQALNATLLCRLCIRIFNDSHIVHGSIIATAGALLFCICPHISEVMVWIACYHYLQGLLFILLILGWVQAFLYSGQTKYAWWAGILFFISTYTLEVCYITPWVVLFLLLYYRIGLHWDEQSYRKALKIFFVPMLLLLAVYMIQYRLLYGEWVSHIRTGSVKDGTMSMMAKVPKYLFNILLIGRYWNQDTIRKVYALCDSAKGLAAFYAPLAAILGIIIIRFRQWNNKAKAISLLLIWTLATFAVVVPIGFYDLIFPIACDRYIYVTCAFLCILITTLCSLIPSKVIRYSVFILYAGVNVLYTVRANGYWRQSAHIVNGLLTSIPDAGNKIIVTLNPPEGMYGIPMMGATGGGTLKRMHNLLYPTHPLNNITYDGASYYLYTGIGDAHAQWLNDSTLEVHAPGGAWWIYNHLGNTGYENDAYIARKVDDGIYTITLKLPRDRYFFLIAVKDKWVEIGY